MEAARLAAWCGGELHGDAATPVGPDVVIDSRRVTPGAVFVAFEGARVDGHDYVAQAAESGAGAALVTRRVDAPVAQVVVPDVTAALSELARHVVEEAEARGLVVVGVTGSSGKTSTKDLMAQVLAPAGPTIAPVGSFNNEIGAPLTACRVDADTRFLVAEMGARGLGHVRWLCSITPPTIGVVLNVGNAHLGEFGTVDNITLAKGELVEALDADGWAVLNADDPRVLSMRDRTQARLALFSATGEPDPSAALRVWASEVEPDELQRFGFTLNAAGTVEGSARVQLQILGAHGVANALAAAAAGLAAGLDLDAVAAALATATTRSAWRMQLDQRSDGLAVLNDAYNANPDSMAKAVETVGRLRRPGGRVYAVLGDMLELGEGAAEAHREAGRAAARAGIDELHAVGEFARHLVEGFAESGRPGRYWGDKAEAAADLSAQVSADDVVLVKASRGIGLETVAETLLKEGPTRC